jgi:hypothetical protein
MAMKMPIPFFILLFSFQLGFSQKKPLDHSVYDGWESIGERTISADGKYLAYSVVPQQGDGRLQSGQRLGFRGKRIIELSN